MEFISLEPFVPSGADFNRSKQLFLALGFKISWEAADLIGFEQGNCRFILQQFENKSFAANVMLSVKLNNVEEFWNSVMEKKLPEKFGIRITSPKQQPYGREVNLIDLAGVCWHFIE